MQMEPLGQLSAGQSELKVMLPDARDETISQGEWSCLVAALHDGHEVADRILAALVDFVSPDVALFLEDAGDLDLDLGRRGGELLVSGARCVHQENAEFTHTPI